MTRWDLVLPSYVIKQKQRVSTQHMFVSAVARPETPLEMMNEPYRLSSRKLLSNTEMEPFIDYLTVHMMMHQAVRQPAATEQ